MSKAANRVKTKWNAANYRQIKVSVDPDIAVAFQTACNAADVSMASVLSAYMSDYCKVPLNKPTPPEVDLSTKKKRCKVLAALINQLVQVRDAQEHAKDNIPESFQGSTVYTSAEECIALMDEAIGLLEGVY